MSDRIVRIGGVEVGRGALRWPSSPVPASSRARPWSWRRPPHSSEIAGRLGMPFVFKSSYDKANRTSVDSFRGPGIDGGAARSWHACDGEFDVPVLSDVHTPGRSARPRPGAGLPADSRLPLPPDRSPGGGGPDRQAGQCQEGAVPGPRGHGKRGPQGRGRSGAAGVLLTERGTTFGYHYLVVDFQGMARMAELGRPVVFDATHSVQLPGAAAAFRAGRSALRSAARPRGRRRGDRRLVHRGPSGPRTGAVRRPQFASPSPAWKRCMRSILAIERARREDRVSAIDTGRRVLERRPTH